jgi:hypothetical protein
VASLPLGGLVYHFEYCEQKSKLLYNRPALSESSLDPDIASQFVTFVFDCYNDEISLFLLLAKSIVWEIFKKELVHSTIPQLSPGKDITVKIKLFI